MADSAAAHSEDLEMPFLMPLLRFLAKIIAISRKAPSTAAAGRSNVLAVEQPTAFGDVVVGTHLHPGDKRRAHEALELVARRTAA